MTIVFACVAPLACLSHAPRPTPTGAPDVGLQEVDDRDPLARCRGRWIQRAAVARESESIDQVLAFEPDADGWTMTRTELVRARQVDASAMRDGPVSYRVRFVRDRLLLTPEGAPPIEHTLTMALRNGELVLPACVQLDERTFEIRAWKVDGVFRCSADPSHVPEGPATFPGGGGPGDGLSLPQFYATETELFESGPDRPQREIYFVERLLEANYEERFRLRWDADGVLSLHPSRGYAGYAEERYKRLSDDEWREIEGLPSSMPSAAR